MSWALSHPLVIGCKPISAAKGNLSGGILDRSSEGNLGKGLKTSDIERDKCISPYQEEGRTILIEEYWNKFCEEKRSIYQCFEAFWSSRSCNYSPYKHFFPPILLFSNTTPSALPVFKTYSSLDVIFKNTSIFPCLRFSMFLLVKIRISNEFSSPLEMFSGNIPTSLAVVYSFTALVLQELRLLRFFSLSTAIPSGSVGWYWLIL